MKSAPSGLVTTSHNPSHFLRQISKLLSFCLPGSIRMNRGSLNQKALLNYCWNKEIPRLIIIQGSEVKNKAKLVLFNLENSKNQIETTITILSTILSNNRKSKVRIDVKGIMISYTSEIPLNIRKEITTYLNPFLERSRLNSAISNLTIPFSVNLENQIKGKLLYHDRKESIELLSFTINNLSWEI